MGHDLSSERCVLGAVLAFPDLLDVCGEITEEFFVDSEHARIWGAMLLISSEGREINPASVASAVKCKRSQVLDFLPFAVDTPGEVLHHVSILADRTERQRFKRLGSVVERADDDSISTKQLLADLQKGIDGIPSGHNPIPVTTVGELVGDVIDRVERALTVPGSNSKENSADTGLCDVDALLGGIGGGELCVIAGRPGMGKSALACCMAAHVAAENEPVLYVSLEMAQQELAARILFSSAVVNQRRAMAGQMTPDDRAALVGKAAEISQWPLMLCDERGVTAGMVSRMARRLAEQDCCSLVIVDYLQLMVPRDRRVQRHEQIGEITAELKTLAQLINRPVVALAQLNRDADGPDLPKLSHLRESGSIEQDADIVLFVHQRFPYTRSDEDEGKATIKVAKNRAGETGQVAVVWRKEYTRFESLAPARHSEFDDWNQQHQQAEMF
jgi:replicative DNA helicase